MSQQGRISVAHVAAQLEMGGMEKLLVEFARHADREAFDLHFLSLGARGKLADDIEACGWNVTALNQSTGFRPALVLKLARLFRRLRVHVVHTHNTKPFVYACPAARLARVSKVIHTRHGQRYGASRRDTIVFRLLTRLADRVVCVSHDSANLSVKEGVAPDKLRTIWNGIDVACFNYVGPCAEGPAVMVSRLSPEKDVETLLRAAALAVREWPSFRLEIAGDGPCRPTLEQFARECNLENSVRFLGEIRDVPALLARASLFVLPSLTEGVSLTLLEAMARGLPVVATRVGGNPEVVIEGETGILVPAQDPAALARAMLMMQGNGENARNMGRAGRRRAEEHFDIRHMVSQYENQYRAGLARGAGPGIIPVCRSA
jgi:glycosyltransferase involved in cell wall biosynthesis